MSKIMRNNRSRRMVELATKDKSHAESGDIIVKPVQMVQDPEKDPWLEFKKWKGKIETSTRQEKVETNIDEEIVEPSEPTIFEDSSNSWRPDEKDELTSVSSGNESKEIPVVKEIIANDVFYTEDDNDYSNLKNATVSTFNRKAKYGTLVAADTDNIVTGPEKSEITILQNMIIRPADETVKQNTTTMPELKRRNFEPIAGIMGNSKKLVEVSHRKSRIWDKKDRCVFCDRDVTNFSRHLYRKHKNEDSVRKIIQLPKGDKNKKRMINLLRKEGNLTLIDENKLRPVQRATRKFDDQQGKDEEEYMPCPYCKGIYRLKWLRKHSKICCCNSLKSERVNVGSLGQNLLVFRTSRKSFLDNLRIKTEVFPIMHADRASFNGKNDPVICQYAEDYLRKHKRPHIRTAVSNKIRELGRFLIPLQDIYNIQSLLEVLNTKHYDKVVHAAQIISGYDAPSKTFKAPSLAMHLKTILMAACLAAKTLLLKQDPVLPVTDYTEKLKSVKQFRSLVDERWKFDMSSLALKDLGEKHGKKLQTLPVTSDVIKFREYVVDIAEKSMNVLKENENDRLAFKNLSEASLALTILLNRKRVGDVQYIKLDSYSHCNGNLNQEEMLNVLSESEKLLSAHFKRIITIGKGSKSVPILFPKNVQRYVDTLLQCREKNQLIPEENPFLFALIGSKNNWMNGSSTLRKYAAASGVENPETLTSSRLRKQIATVLQVINLSETEKEQVATFMGHTKKTHEAFYRLPQDVFQTAKIAKLLLMMDKGEGASCQGKTLEEIDIQLENIAQQSEHLDDKESDDEIVALNELCSQSNEIEENLLEEEVTDTRTVKRKKIIKDRQRGTWSNKQKLKMKEFFKKHIKNKIAPKKHECLQFQNENHDLFGDKTWTQIKVFIYNTFRNQT